MSRGVSVYRWRGRRCRRAGGRTLAGTLRHGTGTGDWKTTPMSLRGPAIGVPPRYASPVDGGRIPARIFSSVDFPHPDGPTTARSSPSPTPNVMDSSAVTLASRAGYAFERFRTPIP